MKCLCAMVAVTRANMDRGYFLDLTAVPEDLNTIPDIRWANSKFLQEMVLKALNEVLQSFVDRMKGGKVFRRPACPSSPVWTSWIRTTRLYEVFGVPEDSSEVHLDDITHPVYIKAASIHAAYGFSGEPVHLYGCPWGHEFSDKFGSMAQRHRQETGSHVHQGLSTSCNCMQIHPMCT